MLIDKIKSQTANIGVIGLGYVGLPLSVEKAKAGYVVLGYDVQCEKVLTTPQHSTQKIKMETEDTISVAIKFATGAIGSINATVLTYPKNLEGSLTILGEKGTVRVGGFALNKIEHWEFADEDPMDEEARRADTAPPSVYGYGHLPYYRHVFDVLDRKAEPMCTGREARKTVEIIMKAYGRVK